MHCLSAFGRLGLVALFLIVAWGSASAQILDVNSAINKAGRQRMLSQRIAKAYLQIGRNVDAEKSRQVLDSSLAIFDRQLVELKNYAPTPVIKDTYQQLERTWLSYKDALIGATPSKVGGRAVLDLSEEVLKLAHHGTVQLERYAATDTGRLVNVAGRQRMLSQRMAKFYQALGWGIGGQTATAELEKMRQEFKSAHTELAKAAGEQSSLRNALELVGRQWVFFEAAVSRRNNDEGIYHANDVAVASELILQEMETAVTLFERRSR
jgi:hypothetical protein